MAAYTLATTARNNRIHALQVLALIKTPSGHAYADGYCLIKQLDIGSATSLQDSNIL